MHLMENKFSRFSEYEKNKPARFTAQAYFLAVYLLSLLDTLSDSAISLMSELTSDTLLTILFAAELTSAGDTVDEVFGTILSTSLTMSLTMLLPEEEVEPEETLPSSIFPHETAQQANASISEAAAKSFDIFMMLKPNTFLIIDGMIHLAYYCLIKINNSYMFKVNKNRQIYYSIQLTNRSVWNIISLNICE